MGTGSAEDDLSWVLEQMPHKPPMLLIDEVVRVADPTIQCAATFTSDHIAFRDGGVSNVVAIELIAQTAAALMVYRSRMRGAPVIGGGALLGTRKLDLSPRRFTEGERLEIHVTEIFGQGQLAQMQGEVRDAAGEVVASGTITVAASAPA